MPLHVGVLHYSPSYDVFPLLADPSRCVVGFLSDSFQTGSCDKFLPLFLSVFLFLIFLISF
jgi:hypothetical protein